jgi:hypothetical protein
MFSATVFFPSRAPHFGVCYHFWSMGLISQFLDDFTDGGTPWTSDQLVGRPLPIHRTTEKHTQTPNNHALIGFEPTILASEQAKTVHALDCSATVTGSATVRHKRFFLRL